MQDGFSQQAETGRSFRKLRPVLNPILYFVVVLSWGFSWYAIKLQVGAVPIEASIAWRFYFASAILFVILHVTGRLQRASAADHQWLLLLGLTLFCLNFIAVYAATAYIPSGLVSIVFAFAAVFSSLNLWLFHGRGPSSNSLFGSVAGIAGLSLLFSEDIVIARNSQFAFGVLLAFVGAYSFSVGNFVSMRVRSSLDRASSTAWAMLYGGVITGGVSLVRTGGIPIGTSAEYLFSMLYLSVVASVIGFLSYISLLDRLGPEKAGYVTVLFPIVAMAVSTAVEGVSWTPARLAGAMLTLYGLVRTIGVAPTADKTH